MIQKRALVVYSSSAGYTRHIAKDIADMIPFEADITEVKTLQDHKIDTGETIFDCEPYAIIFVGSPDSALFPSPLINSWISICEKIKGKDVALFITYWGYPGTKLREMERMFRDKGANIVGSLGINPNEIDSRKSELLLLKRFISKIQNQN